MARPNGRASEEAHYVDLVATRGVEKTGKPRSLDELEYPKVSGYPILAAIDLDGTLLSVDGKLPEENRNAIRDWVRAGRFVAILTARSPLGMRTILSELSVPCVASAFSGGLAWHSSAPDWTSGSSLIDAPLPNEIAISIWNTCLERGVPAILYTRLGAMGNIPSDAIEREVATTGEPVMYSEVIRSIQAVYKLNIMASTSDVNSALRSLPALLDVSVNITRGGNIELTSYVSSKGHALSVACAAMGIGREDVIAVGDGDNDVSMFQAAGVSMAVPGATKAAQESADIVLSGEGPTVVGSALLSALSWRRPGPSEYATLGRYVRHQR